MKKLMLLTVDMREGTIRHLLASNLTRGLIALVWVLFALLGKLAPLRPIHQQIVARVLGETISGPMTIFIGLGELIIAAWVLSGYRARWCGAVQIGLVLTMNVIEIIVASDLLLWGPFNALFASVFMVAVYFNMIAPRQDQDQKQ